MPARPGSAQRLRVRRGCWSGRVAAAPPAMAAVTLWEGGGCGRGKGLPVSSQGQTVSGCEVHLELPLAEQSGTGQLPAPCLAAAAPPPPGALSSSQVGAGQQGPFLCASPLPVCPEGWSKPCVATHPVALGGKKKKPSKARALLPPVAALHGQAQGRLPAPQRLGKAWKGGGKLALLT